MGYDLARFEEEVDEELICPICSAVLEDPVQAPGCEHAFCRECISEWLCQQTSCPVDRHNVLIQDLEPVPRILRNLLSRLNISCANKVHGCTTVWRLDALARHEADCALNPSRPIMCTQGCGITVPKDSINDHNCVSSLRELVDSQKVKLDELHERVSQQQLQLQLQAREIVALKESISGVGSLDVSMLALGTNGAAGGENGSGGGGTSGSGGSGGSASAEVISEWARTLPRARVSHWGRLISTPDTVLQSVIRRSLVDSGCNAVVAEELMSRSDERGWPPGLRSLEMRQLNRTNFQRFICRRLPGNQAVLLLSFENQELPSHLSLPPPGIIMIFANGVDSVTSI